MNLLLAEKGFEMGVKTRLHVRDERRASGVSITATPRVMNETRGSIWQD